MRSVTVLLLLALSACGNLPRGAALHNEVTREAASDNAQFDLIPVNRANALAIADWPITGWKGAFLWIKASRGPQSQVLRVGDQINLKIWDNQDNSLLTPLGVNFTQMDGLVVSPSGTIFVPYVGDVVVNGLTPDGARGRIQRELSPIAPDAQVQLTATPGIANSVSVVGGVAKPGSYPLPTRDTSILSMIASAGGISPNMRNPVVSLIRGNTTYSIPAKDLFDSPNKNARLHGDDNIVVQQDDRAFTALGAAGSESLIYFPKEYVTALEAMSLMGGINDDRADPKGILVLREYPASAVVAAPHNGPKKQQVIFSLDLTSADGLFAARNFLINPNDTVLATESPIVVLRTVLSLFGTALGTTAQVASTVNTVSN
ncbi:MULTISPECIES: polysaccharide biosynthesis/export family protein [unclassified Marinovum]